MPSPGFKDPFDLASTDALINRVRARLGKRPLDVDDAHAFYAGRNVGIVEAEASFAEDREQLAQEAGLAFRDQFPALTRWRDRILKRPRRHKASDVAAAYECLALELTLAGELHLAERAHAHARKAVGVGRIDGEALSA